MFVAKSKFTAFVDVNLELLDILDSFVADWKINRKWQYKFNNIKC